MSLDANKSRVGIAGVHFVAAELSQRGYVATVTSRNTEGIDILAARPDGTKAVSIQIKTRGQKQRGWIMRSNGKKGFRNLVYIFVELHKDNTKPDFFIVPSRVVANYLATSHKKWMKKRSKERKKHKDTNMRVFDYNKAKEYLNKWKKLGL